MIKTQCDEFILLEPSVIIIHVNGIWIMCNHQLIHMLALSTTIGLFNNDKERHKLHYYFHDHVEVSLCYGSMEHEMSYAQFKQIGKYVCRVPTIKYIVDSIFNDEQKNKLHKVRMLLTNFIIKDVINIIISNIMTIYQHDPANYITV